MRLRARRAAAAAFIPCTPKFLPAKQQIAAAHKAIAINPVNRPLLVQPGFLAVMTQKYWGAAGVKLTVGFPFDATPADVQRRILEHMNAWGKFCNATFVLTTTDPQVRINRGNDGYWSYLGTDILSIPKNQPTMNLQGFTMNTPESEWKRVVRHETGHTLGAPHEHMRKQLVARLDRAKTIAWGKAVLGWDQQTVIQQILTPLNEASIRGTPNADQDSIMTYSLPASITVDGEPIRGGVDIDALDAEFIGRIYPSSQPPPPPPPPSGRWAIDEQSDSRLVLKRSAA